MRIHGYTEECKKLQLFCLGAPKQLTFTCSACVCVGGGGGMWCVQKEGRDGVASLTQCQCGTDMCHTGALVFQVYSCSHYIIVKYLFLVHMYSACSYSACHRCLDFWYVLSPVKLLARCVTCECAYKWIYGHTWCWGKSIQWCCEFFITQTHPDAILCESSLNRSTEAILATPLNYNAWWQLHT